jgi:predicted nucleic acid-binding protein
VSGAPVVVSAVTLAEVLRGHPRDAAIHLLLKGCRVEPVSRAIGREAGELLGRTGRKDTVDAVVVATAAMTPGRVMLLTSDVGDLRALAADLPAVEVRRV